MNGLVIRVSSWRLGHFKDALYASKPSLDISEAVLNHFNRYRFHSFKMQTQLCPFIRYAIEESMAIMWKDVCTVTSVVLPDGAWLSLTQSYKPPKIFSSVSYFSNHTLTPSRRVNAGLRHSVPLQPHNFFTNSLLSDAGKGLKDGRVLTPPLISSSQLNTPPQTPVSRTTEDC